MRDYPGLIVAATISLYWGCVVAMSVRLRRRTHSLAGVVPKQGAEKAMWLVWVPVIALWIALPWQALQSPPGWFAIPGAADPGPYATVRWIAALAAVVALLATLRCWRQMGRHWTMAVVPGSDAELLTTGMFARVRHPIYALSIALIGCTLLVVPTWPLAVIAAVHVGLMFAKARIEERFMLSAHGSRYAAYCARTGRFLPRLLPSSGR